VKKVVPEIAADIGVLNQAYLEPKNTLEDYQKVMRAVDNIQALAVKSGVVDA
jgi:hypothetical protein